MKKRTILKEAAVLLIATLMVLSSVVAMVNTEETPLTTKNLGATNYTVEELMIEGTQQINMVSPDEPQSIGRGDLIWDNGPDTGGAYSSQRDLAYPFISQVADDFLFEEETSVEDVHWWGNFWGTGDPIDPLDFEIYIYADDGTGNAPTGGGMPDPSPTALASYYFPSVTGLPLSGNGNYEYDVILDPAFTASAGVKYWIAIVSVFNFPPQWGWTSTTGIQLHPAVQGFPLLVMDFWTDIDPPVDMAFYLTGTTGGGPGGVVWDNNMNYNHMFAAQYEEGGLDCRQADDFHFEEDTDVNDVHWVGGYWQTGYQDAHWPWEIIFWFDDGTGNAPGDMMASFYYDVGEYTETFIEDTGTKIHYEFSVVLPDTLTFIGCEKYWITIWAYGAAFPQSGWAAHEDPIIMHQAVWWSDYFGLPPWTDTFDVTGYAADMCFQLTYEEIPEEGSIDVEKYVWDPEIEEWVDADTEGEAVDFEICTIAEFKIVVHNDGNAPIYKIIVIDEMDDSMEFEYADPPPDYLDGNYMEWYGGVSIPYELYPCESFEIYVFAHVVGPHCSIDENYAAAYASCDIDPFDVFDEDSAWIHCVDPDIEPPVTTIEIDGDVGDNDWYTSDVTITITATDDISGVKETWYRIDGGDWTLYADPIIYGDDGEHTVEAYSIDNADNVEDPPVAEDFDIDQTDPTIDLTWDEENSKLVADVDDETSGVAKVEFYVNGELIGTVTEEPYEMECDASSGDLAYAIVYDNAGNSAESDEIESFINNQQQQSSPVLQRKRI